MFGRIKTAAALKVMQQQLDNAQAEIDQLKALIENRAALVSIHQDGKELRFLFVRNGELISIETYATLSADIPAWRRALLETE